MARSTDAQKAERLNAAHNLLARGTGMREAVVSLSRQFEISRRQAYRYLREAEMIGHPVPVVCAIGANHTQDTGQHRGRGASVFGDQRIGTQRDRHAGDHGFSDRRTRAWLTGGRAVIDIKSTSITHLIVCTPANFSRSTSGWFPTRRGLPARVQR